jgi:hypothetical protein
MSGTRRRSTPSTVGARLGSERSRERTMVVAMDGSMVGVSTATLHVANYCGAIRVRAAFAGLVAWIERIDELQREIDVDDRELDTEEQERVVSCNEVFRAGLVWTVCGRTRARGWRRGRRSRPRRRPSGICLRWKARCRLARRCWTRRPRSRAKNAEAQHGGRLPMTAPAPRRSAKPNEPISRGVRQGRSAARSDASCQHAPATLFA